MKHLQPSIGYPSTGTQDRLIDYNYYYQVAMYYVVSGVARIYFVVGTKIVKPRQFPITKFAYFASARERCSTISLIVDQSKIIVQARKLLL